MEEIEKLLFWGEKRTIADIIEDNRQLELKLFKVALKNYLIEMENQNQLDSILLFFKPRVLIPIILTIGIVIGAAYIFKIF